jgi:hypothetical protein
MANHVYTNIHIRFENKELCHKFASDIIQYEKWMKGKSDPDTSYWQRISKLQSEYFKIICPDVEETRGDYIDKLGAKWISFEDIDFDDTEVNLTINSAWSPAYGLFERIYNHAAKIDPDVSLLIDWEDEGFNFIGAASYNKFGDDFDEYVPTEKDLELLNDEDVDRSDEFYEMMSDRMADLIDCVLYNTSFTLNKTNE